MDKNVEIKVDGVDNNLYGDTFGSIIYLTLKLKDMNFSNEDVYTILTSFLGFKSEPSDKYKAVIDGLMACVTIEACSTDAVDMVLAMQKIFKDAGVKGGGLF